MSVPYFCLLEMCLDAVFVYEQEEYPAGTPLECAAKSAEYLLAL